MPIVVSHQPSAALTLQLAEAGGKGEYRKWHAQFEQQQEDQKTRAFLGAFGMGSQIGLAGKQMQHQKSMQTAQFAQQQKMANVRNGLNAANAASIDARENATREADTADLRSFYTLSPLASAATRRQTNSIISNLSNASANDPDANRPNSPYQQKQKLLSEIRGRNAAGDAFSVAGSRTSQQNRNIARIRAQMDADPRLNIIPDQLEKMKQSVASRTVSGQTILKADQWGRGGLVGTATDPGDSAYTGKTAYTFLEGTKAQMRTEQGNLRTRIRKELESQSPVYSPVYGPNGERVLGKQNKYDPKTGMTTVEDIEEPGVQVEKMIEERVVPYLKNTHERSVKVVEGMSKAFSDGQKEMSGGGGETQFMTTAPPGADGKIDPKYPSGLKPRETWTAPGGYVMHLADMPGNRGKPREQWQWPQNFMGIPKEVRSAPAEGEERGLLKWPPGPNSEDYDVDDWVIPPTPKPMATTRPEFYREVRKISEMHQGHPHWSHEIAKQIHLQEGFKIETADDKRAYDPEPGQLATGGQARGPGLGALKPHERLNKIWEYGVRQGLFSKDEPKPLNLADAEYQLRTAMSQERQMTPDPNHAVGRRKNRHGQVTEEGMGGFPIDSRRMVEQPSHIGPPPDMAMRGDHSRMRQSGQDAMAQVEGAFDKFNRQFNLVDERGRSRTGLPRGDFDAETAKRVESSSKAFDTLRKFLPGIVDPSSAIDPNELQAIYGPDSEKKVQADVAEAIRVLKANGDLPSTDEEEQLIRPTGPKPVPPSQDPPPKPGRVGAPASRGGGGLVEQMNRIQRDPRLQGPRNRRAKQIAISRLKKEARKVLESNQRVIEQAKSENLPLESLGQLGADIKAAQQILGGK